MNGTQLFVEIDRSLCVCSQTCSEALPTVFRAEGYDMTVIDERPPAELSEQLTEVEAMCPMGAINLTVVDE